MFEPQFDRIGLALSIGAIIILLYFGLLNPSLAIDLWVAFGFWLVGFTGTIFLGLAKLTTKFHMQNLLMIGAFIGMGLIFWAGANYAYAVTIEGSTFAINEKLLASAIGICEELFFGVFVLTILINWIKIPPIIAIVISSLGHAYYHVPSMGQNLPLLMLFTLTFMVARAMYVFVYPKVGVLLGIHGFWNLGVA